MRLSKLQGNTKRGLHFRSYYQFKNGTIAAESYPEGAEPSRTKLICPRKRHAVFKINRIRQTDEEEVNWQN